MLRLILTSLITLALLTPAAATVWQVYLGSNFFAPESLVVAYGDTVVWTNLDGTHNVVEQSTPPHFTSGEPAPPPWSYAYVFTLPLGVYPYYCAVHFPEMSGSVTVIPYGTPPNIDFDPAGSVPDNANVGFGFRMTVAPSDEDQDLTYFSIAVNDSNQWSDWSAFPAFLICDTSLGLFPQDVTLISNSALTLEWNTLYFRAIDSRQVLSPVISRTLNVLADRVPIMDSTVTGVYAGEEIYPDRSAYFVSGAAMALTLHADASPYRGEINAYRCRDAEGNWSDWFPDPELNFADIPPGDYPLQVMARDIAGVSTDIRPMSIHVVAFALTDTLVIVDETRNGPGGPGVPNDAQADSFYHEVLVDYHYRDHDYTVFQFVSPYTLRNAGMVIWHADDKAELMLDNNTRVLDEYLSRGGRLILSGWDVFGSLGWSGDSLEFDSTDFGFRDLCAVSGRRDPSVAPRHSTGFSGDNGFPTCQIDSAKLPASWNGAMDRLWTFDPRAQATVIGRLTVNNPGENPLEGRPAAYICDLGFRVAVFGVPLYFCRFDQVSALMDTLVPLMLLPTSAPPSRPAANLSFELTQNYPNPFNSVTEISFTIPQTSPVNLSVFDVLGRQIAVVVDEPLSAGAHHVRFDASALASGIYFVHLRCGSISATRKMVLMK